MENYEIILLYIQNIAMLAMYYFRKSYFIIFKDNFSVGQNNHKGHVHVTFPYYSKQKFVQINN
jgi:hypothetical protein